MTSYLSAVAIHTPTECITGDLITWINGTDTEFRTNKNGKVWTVPGVSPDVAPPRYITSPGHNREMNRLRRK